MEHVPTDPKIYHIVHLDRLESIVSDEHLWCDATIARRAGSGTSIGIDSIKERRLTRLTLRSHPGLHVGECVPFYFCPRSVMLYLIYQGNHPNLSYHGGQGSILHLESDLAAAVDWAHAERLRWAFTLSNAGSWYFEDRCDLANLGEINWGAVKARTWSGAGVPPAVKDGKQAEFLVESRFPWALVGRIGVSSQAVAIQVSARISGAAHRPRVEVHRDWYY